MNNKYYEIVIIYIVHCCYPCYFFIRSYICSEKLENTVVTISLSQSVRIIFVITLAYQILCFSIINNLVLIEQIQAVIQLEALVMGMTKFKISH